MTVAQGNAVRSRFFSTIVVIDGYVSDVGPSGLITLHVDGPKRPLFSLLVVGESNKGRRVRQRGPGLNWRLASSARLEEQVRK